MSKADIVGREIVKCSRFVVSDQEQLIKPAGYPVESKVRVKTSVMLHFDAMPTKAEIARIPACYEDGDRVELFLHDLEKDS